jgi:hypothetical protein
MNQVIAAAIFMDPGASIELRRIDVAHLTVGGSPDYYLSSALRRAHLDPIDIVAGNSWLTQPNRAFHN